MERADMSFTYVVFLSFTKLVYCTRMKEAPTSPLFFFPSPFARNVAAFHQETLNMQTYGEASADPTRR